MKYFSGKRKITTIIESQFRYPKIEEAGSKAENKELINFSIKNKFLQM